MLAIPLTAVPNQTLKATLNGQYCTLNIYTLSTGLYLDLLVNGSPIVQGVLCLNKVLIVRELYLGFIGDLVFADTQGESDPDYTGLGSRFVLMYVYPSEL